MVKRIMVFALLVTTLGAVSSLSAAQEPDRGPQVIKLKMGTKVLDFNHHQHQRLTKNQCWECHDESLGKISNWSQTTAHKLCIPCHDLNEKGPVSCKSCHKK